MISETDIERALDWMRDNAEKMALARANRQTVENYKSVVKAMIMTEYKGLKLGEQEREAYASQKYKDHLDVIHSAIEEDEKLRLYHEAAQTKISYWQTWSKNQRGGL